ncbi:MAG: efflux RND transporter periplasmic adaptor subunit [Nitrospirae bacterium]|nr:efflux RND transporter periplasmic adaptor subunit [Nitrospirota bacterium]
MSIKDSVIIIKKLIIMLLPIVCCLAASCAKPPASKEVKKSGDIIKIVLEGVITPSHEEKIISSMTGQIMKVNTAKGQKVAKDQVLIEFDRFKAEQAYKNAVITYQKAQVSAETYTGENTVIINNAKEKLLKTYDLYRRGYSSLVELKDAENNYINSRNTNEKTRFDQGKSHKEATKEVERARLEMENAKYNFQNTEVKSMMNGFITDLTYSAGQSVSYGDTIGKIANIDDVILKGGFSPGTYSYINKIRTAEVSCLTTPPLKMKSQVKDISPIADSVLGTPVLFIPIKNHDYLLQPGTKCLISFKITKEQAKTMGLDDSGDTVNIRSQIK